jgi:hypothetical protein
MSIRSAASLFEFPGSVFCRMKHTYGLRQVNYAPVQRISLTIL